MRQPKVVHQVDERNASTTTPNCSAAAVHTFIIVAIVLIVVDVHYSGFAV
jgi:hypothetical protein